MDYKIKDLEEMIIISSDGQSREEALRKLEEYLSKPRFLFH
jgi:phosphotransferase system HPr-like phosphotransfer protein